MLTNKGLVLHAKKALDEKWGYVWGTFGLILTSPLFQEKLKQYPAGVGGHEAFIRMNWLNRRSVDCVGLIKSYMWWDKKDPIYDPNTDVSANEMMRRSTKNGTINTFSKNDTLGLCVWKDGHIGVYIGNGQVIEARGTLQGVIQSPLFGTGAAGWTHWLECPFITYESYDVTRIQTNLNKLGYTLVVDGIYGPATDAAIKHFQINNSLIPIDTYRTTTEEAILKMVGKLENPRKNYIQIIQENSENNANDWITGIDALLRLANDNTNLGELEVFKYLPALIEKIGNKK